MTTHLPADSRLVKMHSGPIAEWTQDQYFYANIIDLLQHLIYLFVARYSQSEVKPPKPMKRPGDVEPEPVWATDAELTAMFGG